MNSKKDNEDQGNDKDSNNNSAKKNDKGNNNSDNSNFFDISNNDSKGDKSNSRFTDYSSTESHPPKGKSSSSLPSKEFNDFKHKINNEIKEITKKINKYQVGSINKKII